MKLTSRKSMTGIQTHANSSLVFNKVYNSMQLLKTTSNCATLTAHILQHCKREKTVLSRLQYVGIMGKSMFPLRDNNSI